MTDFASQIRQACYDYVGLVRQRGKHDLSAEDLHRVVHDVDLIAMGIARVDSRGWVHDATVEQAGKAIDALTDAVRAGEEVEEIIERIAASAG